jgi:CRP-like cAMP-binding protein
MTTEAAVETPQRSTSSIADLLAPYETIEIVPPGRVLFREGGEPAGVYFLHSGEVDLCFSSPKSGAAKSLLLAGAGEILGLTSVMSGRSHDSTGTARTTCITGFIDKNRFLRLLDEKPALWVVVLRMISSNINACWECMRSLAGAR